MLQESFLLPKQHLSERMSPPKGTNRPLRLPLPHFQPSHPFHSPMRARKGGSTGVNSLSDEKDKWRRCFGSGDSSKNRARARDGTCRGGGSRNRGWNDERLKVTDVSRLAIAVVMRSIPVFQMHRPRQPCGERRAARFVRHIKSSPRPLLLGAAHSFDSAGKGNSRKRRMNSGTL